MSRFMMHADSVSAPVVEAGFLPPADSISQMPFSFAASRLAWLLMLTMCLTLAWAFLSETEIVVKAPARLVSDVRTQQLTAPEMGQIRFIHVRDGQQVEAGEVLLTFDDQIARAEVNKVNGLLAAALSQFHVTESLLKEILKSEGDTLDATDDGLKRALNNEQKDDRNVQPTLLSASDRLHSQINDFASRLAVLDAAIAKYDTLLPLQGQRADDYLRLKNSGYVSHAAWQEREQVRLETAAALRDAKQQRHSFLARTLREAQDTLTETRRQIMALQQDQHRALAALERLSIRSPVSGTVQQLAVHTEGAFIGAAQTLMHIVPLDAPLEVHALLGNRDVGFVAVGQSAKLRLDSYDYTRYGLIDATVEHVSADAIADEKQGLVYAVRLRLSEPQRGTNASVSASSDSRLSNPSLKAGLAGTVDITTGRRRVIDYFLSPFQRTAHESLRER